MAGYGSRFGATDSASSTPFGSRNAPKSEQHSPALDTVDLAPRRGHSGSLGASRGDVGRTSTCSSGVPDVSQMSAPPRRRSSFSCGSAVRSVSVCSGFQLKARRARLFFAALGTASPFVALTLAAADPRHAQLQRQLAADSSRLTARFRFLGNRFVARRTHRLAFRRSSLGLFNDHAAARPGLGSNGRLAGAEMFLLSRPVDFWSRCAPPMI